MWWKWAIFIISLLSIIACVISTTIDWVKGKTGPFGPNPADWWGCGVFTLILIALMLWVGKSLFK